MLSTFSKSLVVASILSAAACSQQQAPKSQKVQAKVTHLRDVTANAPVRNDANAFLSCEEIWSSFLLANPQGLSKTYKSTVTTEYLGAEGLPAPETVVETSKDTVTTSSDALISITYEYTSSASTAPIPAETQSIAKADFLASCNAPVANAPAAEAPVPAAPTEAEPTVVITEESTGPVTVAAGTFTADYVKGNITQTGENAYTAIAQEWYLTGTDFLVKSTFESTSVFDTISVKTSQIVELIEYIDPSTPAAPATAGL
ncbi:MAG: hypothetical protein EOP04_20630 [Proteobacteria bacterium]|nr:MAG: hypothetical protein EOP04_20630 [Pseudomonadota bacterium]